MEIRPESTPFGRLIVMSLGLCAGISIFFVWLFRASIIPWAHCPFRAATKVPCPTCGGTHALVSLLQGRIGHAMRINPLVSLVVMLSALMFLWSLGAMVIPSWRVALKLSRREKQAALVMAGLAILAAWFYEIWRLI